MEQNGKALVPIEAIEKMATSVAKSGLFGVKTVDQAIALMLIAEAEGRHPASAAQDYDIINGRPALKSSSLLARFQAAGGKIQWVQRDDKAAEAIFEHAQGGTLTVRWDMARAAKAGLTGKATWRQYPAQILSARVISEGVRAILPGVSGNFYVGEEVQDFAPPKSLLKKQAPAPKQEAPKAEAEATERAPQQAEAVDAQDGPSSDEVREIKLQEVYDTLGDIMLKYVKRIKWIPENGTLKDIKPEQADRITGKTDMFVAAVRKFEAEQAKKESK